ncbi:MAG: hypothetical protein ACE5FJ_03630 [Gemmatimonadales bacterium]
MTGSHPGTQVREQSAEMSTLYRFRFPGQVGGSSVQDWGNGPVRRQELIP